MTTRKETQAGLTAKIAVGLTLKTAMVHRCGGRLDHHEHDLNVEARG